MRRIAYLCACGMLLFLLACGGGTAATGLVSATEQRPPLKSDTIRRPAGLHSEMIRQEPTQLTPID